MNNGRSELSRSKIVVVKENEEHDSLAKEIKLISEKTCD